MEPARKKYHLHVPAQARHAGRGQRPPERRRRQSIARLRRIGRALRPRRDAKRGHPLGRAALCRTGRSGCRHARGFPPRNGLHRPQKDRRRNPVLLRNQRRRRQFQKQGGFRRAARRSAAHRKCRADAGRPGRRSRRCAIRTGSSEFHRPTQSRRGSPPRFARLRRPRARPVLRTGDRGRQGNFRSGRFLRPVHRRTRIPVRPCL